MKTKPREGCCDRMNVMQNTSDGNGARGRFHPNAPVIVCMDGGGSAPVVRCVLPTTRNAAMAGLVNIRYVRGGNSARIVAGNEAPDTIRTEDVRTLTGQCDDPVINYINCVYESPAQPKSRCTVAFPPLCNSAVRTIGPTVGWAPPETIAVFFRTKRSDEE